LNAGSPTQTNVAGPPVDHVSAIYAWKDTLSSDGTYWSDVHNDDSLEAREFKPNRLYLESDMTFRLGAGIYLDNGTWEVVDAGIVLHFSEEGDVTDPNIVEIHVYDGATITLDGDSLVFPADSTGGRDIYQRVDCGVSVNSADDLCGGPWQRQAIKPDGTVSDPPGPDGHVNSLYFDRDGILLYLIAEDAATGTPASSHTGRWERIGTTLILVYDDGTAAQANIDDNGRILMQVGTLTDTYMATWQFPSRPTSLSSP
jgi:hypothetical protein